MRVQIVGSQVLMDPLSYFKQSAQKPGFVCLISNLEIKEEEKKIVSILHFQVLVVGVLLLLLVAEVAVALGGLR